MSERRAGDCEEAARSEERVEEDTSGASAQRSTSSCMVAPLLVGDEEGFDGGLARGERAAACDSCRDLATEGASQNGKT